MLITLLNSGRDVPWLSLLLLLLPLGALLTGLLPNREARWAALTTALLVLAISLGLVWGFDRHATGFQFVEDSAWIPSLGIHYLIGVDGLSLLFLPCTALLFVAVILASWNAIRQLPRLYFALLLLLECTILGIFTALDGMLFFLFWELTLMPLFFLISLWGNGANRRFAAVKYTLFMLAGGLPLLIGLVALALQQPTLSFAYPALLHASHTGLISHALQVTVFFLLLVGFGVKIPVFPLHTWLPVVAQEGPAGVVAILSFTTGIPLNLAIPVGVILFMIGMIPMFGASIAGVISALIIGFNAWYAGLIFIVYFVVYQQIENNLISPMIQAKSNQLSALIIIVAITIGIYAAGLLGAFLSIPVAACVKILFEEFYLVHHKKKPAENKETISKFLKSI